MAQGSEMLFRQMPHPAMGLVDHANRLGIRLKSSNYITTGLPHSPISGRSYSGTTARTCPPGFSSRARTSPHRLPPTPAPTVQYIHNVVIPLNTQQDEANLQSATTTRAFSSSRARASPPSAVRIRDLVNGTSSTKSQGTKSRTSILSKNRGKSPVPGGSISSSPEQDWNGSEQATRYLAEQDKLDLTRTRKRSSEADSPAVLQTVDPEDITEPHRMDRLYYMSGSGIALRDKYSIDDTELNQLREMAKTRRQTKHYGRGLSGHPDKMSSPAVRRNSDVPRQPPPSSIGDTETVGDGLTGDEALINDTQSERHTDDTLAMPAATETKAKKTSLSQTDNDAVAEANNEPSDDGLADMREQGAGDGVTPVRFNSQPHDEALPVIVSSSLETEREGASTQPLDTTQSQMILPNGRDASATEPWGIYNIKDIEEEPMEEEKEKESEMEALERTLSSSKVSETAGDCTSEIFQDDPKEDFHKAFEDELTVIGMNKDVLIDRKQGLPYIPENENEPLERTKEPALVLAPVIAQSPGPNAAPCSTPQVDASINRESVPLMQDPFPTQMKSKLNLTNSSKSKAADRKDQFKKLQQDMGIHSEIAKYKEKTKNEPKSSRSNKKQRKDSCDGEIQCKSTVTRPLTPCQGH